MLLKRIMPGLLLALAVAPAHAAGYEILAGAWNYDAGGQIAQPGSSAGSTISLDNDSGIHSNPQVLALLRYRSDGGWIPDASAGYVHLGAAGTYLANSNFSIGGISIVKGRTEVGAGVNINDFEAGADWRLFNGLLSPHDLRLAAGLSLEYLTGHASYSGTERFSLIGLPLPSPVRQQQYFAVDQFVPLPHLRLEAQPRPWLHLDLSGGYIFEGDQHVAELRALAQVRLWWQVWLSAGYQYQGYRVDIDPYVLDARVSGPVLALSIARW